MTATDGLDLNQVTAFVRVMESGSFTAAARELGLPKSSVSRRVSALETALRVRLLQRSTRLLVLTEAGRLYFERARAALRGLAEANVAVTDRSHEIAGPIRFTAGGDNTGLIAGLLAEFLARHPKIQIDVVMTPRRVDLVAEGFDLALRAGPLVDSALIARRLGRTELGLFASPAYLRKAGRPKHVANLAKHRFVLFGEPHEREHLRLTGPDGEESVKVQGALVVHDMSFAVDAISTGIGIGLVPDMYLGWMVKGGMRSGGRDLVRVSPLRGGRLGAEPGVAEHRLRADACRPAARLSRRAAPPDDRGLHVGAGSGEGQSAKGGRAGEQTGAQARGAQEFARGPTRTRSGLGDDLKRPPDDALEDLRWAPRAAARRGDAAGVDALGIHVEGEGGVRPLGPRTSWRICSRSAGDSTGNIISTRRCKLRGIQSADERKTSALPPGRRRTRGSCSRKRPTMLMTRMFSLTPGTPGRRQQMPRTIRVDRHARLRGAVERLDDRRVHQRVHLGDDAAGSPALARSVSRSISARIALVQVDRRHRQLAVHCGGSE